MGLNGECKWKKLEEMGIDPITSRMLSERSTIWATPPYSEIPIFTLNKNQASC